MLCQFPPKIKLIIFGPVFLLIFSKLRACKSYCINRIFIQEITTIIVFKCAMRGQFSLMWCQSHVISIDPGSLAIDLQKFCNYIYKILIHSFWSLIWRSQLNREVVIYFVKLLIYPFLSLIWRSKLKLSIIRCAVGGKLNFWPFCFVVMGVVDSCENAMQRQLISFDFSNSPLD